MSNEDENISLLRKIFTKARHLHPQTRGASKADFYSTKTFRPRLRRVRFDTIYPQRRSKEINKGKSGDKEIFSLENIDIKYNQ